MIVPSAAMGVTDFVVVAGVPANPDSITAVLYRWVGSTRSASGVTVTPTAVGSGEYRFTWTNDAGWSRTDELELVAIPVVDSVAYPATIWRSHGGVDAVMRGTDSVPNSTIADAYALLQLTDADVALIKAAMDALSAMLPATDYLAGAATDDGYAVLDTAARVKLDADQPDYAPLKAPELRGDLTLAEAVDLILAGVLGVSSQPDAATELFKFVDAADAFVTTFDTAGNRTAVVLQ